MSNCSFLSLILISTCGFSSIYFLLPTPVPFKYRFLLFAYTTLLTLHFIFTYVNISIFRIFFHDFLLFCYELYYALRPTKNGFDLCCLVTKVILGIISYKWSRMSEVSQYSFIYIRLPLTTIRNFFFAQLCISIFTQMILTFWMYLLRYFDTTT